MKAPQLALFHLPRVVDPGEAGRCVCGRFDAFGGWGPPGLVEVEGYTQSRAETWFCGPHLAREWRAHLERRAALAKRSRRLEVFRACQREGLRGVHLFAEAERRLGALEVLG